MTSTSTSPTASAQTVCAAIYLRISQDREMDGLAIDRQREDCERLAAFRGWEVVETYVDQSKSATDKTKRRPGYDRMVADYTAGRFTAIVCYDLDRLTRQPRQLEDWIDAAEEQGLALVTANGDADLSTDGGRMYARIKAAVARAEMERKAARQSRAQVQRAQQGRPPKGIRPLGYSVDGGVIAQEAEAVQAIFASFHAGMSLRAIARGLSGPTRDGKRELPVLPRHSRTLVVERNARRAEEGLAPKPVPDDGPWAESTVLGILRNPRYAGYSVYTRSKDREKVVAENLKAREENERPRGKRRAWRDQILTDDAGEPIRGQWEPLIDEDVWKKVQDMLDDPARITNRSGTHRRHLGSGLYRCAECRQPIRGASRGYRCKVPGHLNRTGSHIDNYVQKVIVARLAAPDALATVPAEDASSPRLQEIDREIKKQRSRIRRAQNDYDEEVIEASDLRRVRTGAEAIVQGLEAERLSLTSHSKVVPILGSENPAEAFLTADLAVKRTIVDALCVVTLSPHPQGRKGFDPDTVDICWR